MAGFKICVSLSSYFFAAKVKTTNGNNAIVSVITVTSVNDNFLQDEKNEIITTNVWLQQVGTSVFSSTKTKTKTSSTKIN